MRYLVLLCPTAFLLLTLAQPARAGTELYGLLSAGLLSGHGFTVADRSIHSMAEQGRSSNRWGVRGSELVGGGLSASFTLESSLSVRSGAAGRDAGGTATQGTGSLFDREARLALESMRFGSVSVGRGKNLLEEIDQEFDPRENANFAGLKPVARYAGAYGSSGVSRFERMLRYSSTRWKGLGLDAAYSFGGLPGNVNRSSSFVAGTRYDSGPFALAYAHATLRLGGAGVTAVNQRVDQLVGKWSSGRLMLGAGYIRTRNPAGGGFEAIAPGATVAGRTAANTWFAGARYKWSEAIAFNAGYYDLRGKAGAGDEDVKMVAAGVTYATSKRTELFADVARASRAASASAPFTLFDRFRSDGVTPSESTRPQAAVHIGVQHKF